MTLPHHDAAAPARSPSARYGLLIVLATTMLLDALEVSLALVAVPTVAAELRGSVFAVSGLISGFAAGFGAALLTGERLVTRCGRRPAYLGALMLFAAASLAGGLTANLAVLVLVRVVTGLSCGLTAPAGLAIITSTFTDRDERHGAARAYALAGGSGFLAGLLVSGWLTSLSWRLTIGFPALVVVPLLAAAWVLLPRDGRTRAAPPARPSTLGSQWLRATLGAACLNGTNLGLLLVTAWVLGHQWRWSPMGIALAVAPVGGLLVVTVPAAHRLIRRFGTQRLILAGAVPPLLAAAWWLRPGTPSSYPMDILPPVLGLGAGFVLAFAALNSQATAEVAEPLRPVAGRWYQSGVQAAAVVVPALAAALLLHGGPRAAASMISTVAGLGVVAAWVSARSIP